jgi:hypothetical protein
VNRLAGFVVSYVEACRSEYVVLTYTNDVFARSTSNCSDPMKLQNGQRPDQTLPIARRFRLLNFVSVTHPSTKKARTRALPFPDFFSFRSGQQRRNCRWVAILAGGTEVRENP